MYTGGNRVGKIVAKAAADTLTPTTLEVSTVTARIVHALSTTAWWQKSRHHLQVCRYQEDGQANVHNQAVDQWSNVRYVPQSHSS